jgi:putative hydrolase
VHSKLRMGSQEMGARMRAAVANPHTDVLGHCTGRYVMGKHRPESQFDADAVFTACPNTVSRSR